MSKPDADRELRVELDYPPPCVRFFVWRGHGHLALYPPNFWPTSALAMLVRNPRLQRYVFRDLTLQHRSLRISYCPFSSSQPCRPKASSASEQASSDATTKARPSPATNRSLFSSNFSSTRSFDLLRNTPAIHQSRRLLSTSPDFHSSTLSTIPTCPFPTCSCADTPDLPSDKPIDRTSSLTNTRPNYDTHAIIYTGKNDWASKIEFDTDGPNGRNVAAQLKSELADWRKQAGKQGRRGGVWGIWGSSDTSTANVEDPGVVMVSNSSFAAARERSAGPEPSLERQLEVVAKERGLAGPVQLALLPNPRRATLMEIDGQIPKLTAWPAPSPGFRPRVLAPDVARGLPVQSVIRDITSVIVLICGHGGRDTRCGILGPLLKEEFERQLQRLHVRVLQEPEVYSHPLEATKGYQEPQNFDQWPMKGSPALSKAMSKVEDTTRKLVGEIQHTASVSEAQNVSDPSEPKETSGISASVGLVSHIGGHKWAGNVIIYFPSSYSPPAASPRQDSDPNDDATATGPTTGKMGSDANQLSALAGKGVWYGRVEPRHVEGLATETILKGRVVEELCRGVT